jgi:fatty acid-binding protein DegV
MSKAIDRLLDLVEADVSKLHTPIRLSTLHANCQKEADELLARARQRFGVSEVDDTVVTDVSPVIGTHTGPGALGFAYMAGL